MTRSVSFLLFIVGAAAFPRINTLPQCRAVQYQNSVIPGDEGISIRFEPSDSAVRQILEVVTHLNVTCGEYFRYVEDHPMKWRGGYYSTDLKKEKLLVHCMEQSEIQGIFDGIGGIKVAPRGGKNFATFFAEELDPYTEYKMMISEKPCEESSSKKNAKNKKSNPAGETGDVEFTAIANEKGGIYQVAEVTMPEGYSDPEKATYYARLVGPDDDEILCAEMDSMMPEADLTYAFNFTIENTVTHEDVGCNTGVFRAKSSIWKDPADHETTQASPQMENDQMEPLPRPQFPSRENSRDTVPVSTAPVGSQGTRSRRSDNSRFQLPDASAVVARVTRGGPQRMQQPMGGGQSQSQYEPQRPKAPFVQQQSTGQQQYRQQQQPRNQQQQSRNQQQQPRTRRRQQDPSSVTVPSRASATRMSGEGEECSTAYGQVCRSGLACIRQSSDLQTPGVCTRASFNPDADRFVQDLPAENFFIERAGGSSQSGTTGNMEYFSPAAPGVGLSNDVLMRLNVADGQGSNQPQASRQGFSQPQASRQGFNQPQGRFNQPGTRQGFNQPQLPAMRQSPLNGQSPLSNLPKPGRSRSTYEDFLDAGPAPYDIPEYGSS